MKLRYRSLSTISGTSSPHTSHRYPWSQRAMIKRGPIIHESRNPQPQPLILQESLNIGIADGRKCDSMHTIIHQPPFVSRNFFREYETITADDAGQVTDRSAVPSRHDRKN